MTNKNSIFIIYLASCLISFSSSAQFTYLDAGLSFSNVTLNANRKVSALAQVTALNTGKLHFGAMQRFNQYFAAGIDVGLPIAQKSKFTLKFAEAGNPYSGVSTVYFDEDTEERYKPQKFDYNFRQSIQIGFIARAFLNGNTNLFLDLRISALKLKEEFVFQRIARPSVNTGYSYEYRPPIAAVNIQENHQKLLIIPGFALGWQPHIDDRFFINFNLAFDFYSMKDESFSYWVPYLTRSNSQGSTTYSVRLASQLTNTKLAKTATIRFGMFI